MNLFMVPHQDDELLTMGISALKANVKDSASNHIYICTDGSSSCVQKVLSNFHKCDIHTGRHHYFISKKAFIEARDTEFKGSCMALGFIRENIHITNKRKQDGFLLVSDAEKMITEAMRYIDAPDEVRVHTMYPLGGKQHQDHTNLGLATLNLYRKGVIKHLYMYVEPYCMDILKENKPEEKYDILICDNDKEKQQLKKAVGEYCKWDPKKKRYAIGYHSVNDLFDSFLENPSCNKIKVL